MTFADQKLMRRVAGYHDIRLDGLSDLLLRARGMSVLDVGCNRGLVGFEFANNGARLVHGCDNYEDGIRTARELFCDMRNVANRFEIVDLTQGVQSLERFGEGQYDIVLVLAVIHKIARGMPADTLATLVHHLGSATGKYLAWRGTAEDAQANEIEEKMLGVALGAAGLKRIHFSAISDLGPAAIWARA